MVDPEETMTLGELRAAMAVLREIEAVGVTDGSGSAAAR